MEVPHTPKRPLKPTEQGTTHKFTYFQNIFIKELEDSPSTQLASSSIIVRKDKKNLKKKTNARLNNYCSQKGLGYIENNGIKEVHLGKKRLYLNKNGNSALAKKSVTLH